MAGMMAEMIVMQMGKHTPRGRGLRVPSLFLYCFFVFLLVFVFILSGCKAAMTGTSDTLAGGEGAGEERDKLAGDKSAEYSNGREEPVEVDGIFADADDVQPPVIPK